MAIRVRAIAVGVYGIYREEGDEFEIKDDQAFSEAWMSKIENEPPARIGVENGHASHSDSVTEVDTQLSASDVI